MTIDPFAPDADVEFSEPEPPDDFFSSAPAAPTASASIPAPATPAGAGADLSNLAARLGADLSAADLALLQTIGAELGLCKADAMWILFLLQIKAGGAFRAVPGEVEKVILQGKEAAELQAKMASADAANAAAKATKKDIFKALSDGDRKTLKPLFSVAAGASFVSLALGGVVGFWLGNFSNTQHNWVFNLANFFGIGV